jgi:hypothetical protein
MAYYMRENRQGDNFSIAKKEKFNFVFLAHSLPGCNKVFSDRVVGFTVEKVNTARIISLR